MNKQTNLHRNILILVVGTLFLIGGIIGQTTEAQTKTSAKSTPTPKKATVTKTAKPTPKTSVKPSATKSPATKITPKPTPNSTSKTTQPKPKSTPSPTPAKPKELPQIIVSVTSGRVRKEPDTSAETLQTVKLGTTFGILGQNDKWFNVKLLNDENAESGWISKTISQTFLNSKRSETYQKLADKYLSQTSTDFATSAQVFEFLTKAATEVTDSKQVAELSLKRLRVLQSALRQIPLDKQDQNPYKDFLQTNQKEIVYSEPAGQWYVGSVVFWELHEKFKSSPTGEEIAWTASQNPLPGECEGYINCYLDMLRSTDAEYLNFYPNGKYSRQSLKNIINLLEPIVADARDKTIYVSAGDISDRADFNRYLTELRAIISKTPHLEKSKPLQQIKLIGEAHR